MDALCLFKAGERGKFCLQGLTFELSGRQRQDASARGLGVIRACLREGDFRCEALYQ